MTAAGTDHFKIKARFMNILVHLSKVALEYFASRLLASPRGVGGLSLERRRPWVQTRWRTLQPSRCKAVPYENIHSREEVGISRETIRYIVNRIKVFIEKPRTKCVYTLTNPKSVGFSETEKYLLTWAVVAVLLEQTYFVW